MALGVPLMGLITVSQFRAVLAHEFGHYHGGDTKLGPWIYKTRSAIWRTLAQLEAAESILAFLFSWYGKMFLRVTLAISRAQEYAADRMAAQVAGARAMIEGLKQLHRGAVVWDGYMTNEVVPVLNAGFSPPLASGLLHFLRSPDIEKPVAESLEHELENGKADPMDSHPSLPERIAALKELPDQRREDTRPATDLLENFSSVDATLFLVDEGSPDLRTVAWDDIVEDVWVPRWQSQIERQAAALTGLTIFDLRHASQNGTIQRKFRDPDGFLPTPEQRNEMAIGVAGGVLALALFSTGWKIHALPGELYCEKDGESLEPFAVMGKVARGEMTEEEWSNLCTRLGIADLPVIATHQAHA